MNSEVIITDKDLPPEVLRAIKQGRKIEAIKILREATGLGLANAKVLVDRAARLHGPERPPLAFPEAESTLSRLLKSLLLATLLLFFYRHFFGG